MSPPKHLQQELNVVSRRRRFADFKERMEVRLRAYLRASHQWIREVQVAERRGISSDYCHANKDVFEDDHVMDWS